MSVLSVAIVSCSSPPKQRLFVVIGSRCWVTAPFGDRESKLFKDVLSGKKKFLSVSSTSVAFVFSSRPPRVFRR